VIYFLFQLNGILLLGISVIILGLLVVLGYVLVFSIGNYQITCLIIVKNIGYFFYIQYFVKIDLSTRLKFSQMH